MESFRERASSVNNVIFPITSFSPERINKYSAERGFKPIDLIEMKERSS
jgi:hypothetical protein